MCPSGPHHTVLPPFPDLTVRARRWLPVLASQQAALNSSHLPACLGFSPTFPSPLREVAQGRGMARCNGEGRKEGRCMTLLVCLADLSAHLSGGFRCQNSQNRCLWFGKICPYGHLNIWVLHMSPKRWQGEEWKDGGVRRCFFLTQFIPRPSLCSS